MAEPIRVGALLGTIPGVAARLGEARLFAAWPDIAGPAAPRSRADCIDGGVLHVVVDSPGWLHRLTLDEAVLLARCRAMTDIRAIRFHLAPLDRGAPLAPPGAATPADAGTAPNERIS